MIRAERNVIVVLKPWKIKLQEKAFQSASDNHTLQEGEVGHSRCHCSLYIYIYIYIAPSLTF